MANIIVFTVHKAASMVLHNLLMQVTAVTRMNYYSPNLPETPFFFPPPKHNWESETAAHLARLSGCIGPIRRPIDILDPGQSRIILHLRDPRDVLTSLFFSHCYSHFGWENREREREEWIKAGIDKYVLDKSGDYAERYDAYCDNLLGKPNVTFVTYEEMVVSFETWLRKFLAPFSLPTSENVAKALAIQYRNEFTVSSEDVTRHKRKVTPGDHREKLQPETIHALNQKFSHSLEKFGYRP
jgi:hypothetical protein